MVIWKLFLSTDGSVVIRTERMLKVNPASMSRVSTLNYIKLLKRKWMRVILKDRS